MRPTLTLSLLLLALPGCDTRPAPAADPTCAGPARPEQPLRCFQGCERDADCAAVPSVLPCRCVPWVVNRAYLEVAEEKARRELAAARDLGAPGCGCWTCLARPVCAEGACSHRYECTRPTELDGG